MFSHYKWAIYCRSEYYSWKTRRRRPKRQNPYHRTTRSMLSSSLTSRRKLAGTPPLKATRSLSCRYPTGKPWLERPCQRTARRSPPNFLINFVFSTRNIQECRRATQRTSRLFPLISLTSFASCMKQMTSRLAMHGTPNDRSLKLVVGFVVMTGKRTRPCPISCAVCPTWAGQIHRFYDKTHPRNPIAYRPRP